VGSGYKDFVPGDVLTATEVDGYLMRQTVMTFSSSTTRDSALSGVLDEGMYAYLEDTNALTVYTGSAWEIENEPWVNWAPTITQTGTVTHTVNWGRWRRSRGHLQAVGVFTITGSGSAASDVTITTPATLASSEAIGGSFSLFDDGNTTYAGVLFPNSTTSFRLQVTGEGDTLGTLPNIGLASGDIIRVAITTAEYA
jgi:hypothetical protein